MKIGVMKRALRMIDACNRALIRAQDEQTLLDETCRAIVEIGGYRLVWIGFAETDGAKSVRPAAQKGFEAGYLETLNITWARTKRGRGPTGTAIRRGKPVISQNILTDPAFGPWRAEAVKRGYASSVALPLRIDGRAFGSLNIYSRHADAFNQYEMMLLERLADNLSYGISSLRGRAAQRLSRESLRIDEERLNRILETAPCGIVFVNAEGQITFANAAAEKILELSRSAIAGRTYNDLAWRITATNGGPFPEEALPFARVRQSGAPVYEVEHAIVHADGRGSVLSINAAPLSGADGAFAGMVAAISDITVRRRVEEALRQSNERFFNAFHLGPAAMTITSISDGKFLEANDAFLEMFELGREQVIGHTSTDLEMWSPEERRRIIEKQIESGGMHNFPLQARLRSGRLLHLLFSSKPMNVNGESCHLTTMIDISGIKKAEEALRRSEEKFYKAFHSSPDAIAITRASDGLLVEVNESLERISGYTKEEVIGNTSVAMSFWVDPKDRERYVSLLRTRGTVNDFETRFRTKAGDVRDFVLFAEMYDMNGEPHILGIIRDVTERKRAEQEIRQLNKELEQRVRERTAKLEAINKDLETFAYSVAHDLKAPLRGIDGYSRLLEEAYEGRLDEEGRYFLQNIRKAAQQMDELINDLLAYSRLERRPSAPGKINPRTVFEALLAERADEIKARTIEVSIAVPFDGIVADSQGFVQAARNIVDNAFKFTQGVEKPVIGIVGRESESAWTFAVRDNGVGFDMQYHERVFEIFQRLHRAEEFPGTGIGLAIVRKAMERMGGRVWAEARPGQGATFFLEIPK